MKKNAIALALALTLLGTLAACGTDRNNGGAVSGGNDAGANANSGNASGVSGSDPAGTGVTGSGSGSSTAGSVSGTAGSTASTSGTRASAGQVARRNDGTAYSGRTYWDDGRYTAGSNGRVYDSGGSAASRDLTRDAQDIVRDAGDAIGDVGRGIGDVARDITGMGNGNYSGTPSWEPDPSAVRY